MKDRSKSWFAALAAMMFMAGSALAQGLAKTDTVVG